MRIDHHEYKLCTVDGRLACCSTLNSDKLITFDKLDKKKLVYEYAGIDRLKYVVSTIEYHTGCAPVQFLADMTLVDFIIGNEDRHFRNFGITSDRKLYPLFDFGLGLFEHDYIYDELSLEQAIPKMNKQPFHDWNLVLNYFASCGCLRTGKIDLTGYAIPSNLGRQYLKYSCRKVGIDLCGI